MIECFLKFSFLSRHAAEKEWEREVRSRVALACALFLLASLPLSTERTIAFAQARNTPINDRPNILLIVADDQARSTFSRDSCRASTHNWSIRGSCSSGPT
jgi:hypothetical protein